MHFGQANIGQDLVEVGKKRSGRFAEAEKCGFPEEDEARLRIPLSLLVRAVIGFAISSS
jgi:hypothetical protein